MIELIKIELEELKSYIKVAYEKDEDLLQKYHVAIYDLEDAVDETYRMIEVTDELVLNSGEEMEHFGVELNKEKIGYLCTFQNNLYSYGINIDHRNKEILSEFWNKIKSVVGESFISCLYDNNTRAINWLKKCGMVKVEGISNDWITLLYHN